MIHQTEVIEINADTNTQWFRTGTFTGNYLYFPVVSPAILVLDGVTAASKFLFECILENPEEPGLRCQFDITEGMRLQLPKSPSGRPYRWNYTLRVKTNSYWYAANGHNVGNGIITAAIQLVGSWDFVDQPKNDEIGSQYKFVDSVQNTTKFVPIPWYACEVWVYGVTGPLKIMAEDWNGGRAVLGDIFTVQTGGYWTSKIRGGVIGIDAATLSVGDADVWVKVRS